MSYAVQDTVWPLVKVEICQQNQNGENESITLVRGVLAFPADLERAQGERREEVSELRLKIHESQSCKFQEHFK